MEIMSPDPRYPDDVQFHAGGREPAPAPVQALPKRVLGQLVQRRLLELTVQKSVQCLQDPF